MNFTKPQHEAEEPTFTRATIHDRILATIIDYAIFFAVFGCSFVYLYEIMESDQRATQSEMATLIFFGANLSLLTINILLWHRSGQSIGKFIIRIKIVNVDGSRTSLPTIFILRFLIIHTIAVGLLIIGIGIFIPVIDGLFALNENEQCLHDRIAKTIVINTKSVKSLP